MKITFVVNVNPEHAQHFILGMASPHDVVELNVDTWPDEITTAWGHLGCAVAALQALCELKA